MSAYWEGEQNREEIKSKDVTKAY